MRMKLSKKPPVPVASFVFIGLRRRVKAQGVAGKTRTSDR